VYFADFANRARVQHLLRLHVDSAIALLESEGDVLLRSARSAILMTRLQPATSRPAAFDIDMLSGFDGRLEVFRVKE